MLVTLKTVPGDIHYHLSSFLDISDLKIMSQTLKDEVVYKYRLIRMKNAVRKIGRIYFKNNPFKIWDEITKSDNWDPHITSKITKNIDIRVKSVRYPNKLYQQFPEYLVHNCRHMFTQDEKYFLTNYIDNKLSSNKAERKKSNINKFLRLPQIKIKHLDHAGW